MTTLRTIRESADVSAELERLRHEYPRFQDWWERAWSWRLMRDPVADATRIAETNPPTFLLKTSPRHAEWGFPFTLTLMYTVGDNEIDLIGVRFIEIPIEKP